MPPPKTTLSVAPMMGHTDRHGRYFLRRLTRFTRLYTEMIPAQAITHGDRDRLLAFHESERPLALQLGGGDPSQLAQAARIGAAYGYTEINLNLGCPSARVTEGGFGAALMREADHAARCVDAIAAAVPLPVSVKCRIGVDAQEPERDLLPFLDRLAQSGCGEFILHARKAWLNGISPKENRTLPPLRYDIVYGVKQARPNLRIHLNGGINDLEQARAHVRNLDGVMIGRAAVTNPWMLTQADRLWYGDAAPPPRREAVLAEMLDYAAAATRPGETPTAILRHCIPLYRGVSGGKRFRQRLNALMRRPLPQGAQAAILLSAPPCPA